MKAILTGHTRGLGAAIAENLLSRDIAVLAVSRTRNIELEQRFPTALAQVELDLSQPESLARWLAADLLRHFLSGCQSVLLINNAGTLQPVGPIEDQDVFEISRAVGLNVAVPIMLASAVAVASADASDRRVMHVSSGAGRRGVAGWSVYGATKAALDQHARSVMLDQTPNLRICSLAPGVIDTDMQAEIRASALEKFPLRDNFEALKRNGDLATPGDCAERLVNYLLSEQFGQMPVADLREVVV
jgi:NAD(P)-dependent dehydrogenase (short-subunit alcohol dehydrogenase family)